MDYRVAFAPEAQVQLAELYHFIAHANAPVVAQRYVDAIITYCESLAISPYRGTQRDDIRPGLRITHYKKSAIIAFAVMGPQVTVLGVYYGGQDYETALLQDDPRKD
jgi:toxin ParE1/3/4